MEPWEKGSRKTAGQTGMCGGVSSVGFYIFFTIIIKGKILYRTKNEQYKQVQGVILYFFST